MVKRVMYDSDVPITGQKWAELEQQDQDCPYYLVTHFYWPIYQDVKQYFFQLNDQDRSRLFQLYQKKYGLRVCNYTIQSYPLWKSGKKRMAAITLARLAQWLPLFLTSQQRLSLCSKVMSRIKDENKETYGTYAIEMTWQNYNHLMAKLISNIQNPSWRKQYGFFWTFHIPDDVMKFAKWMNDPEGILIKQLYTNVLNNEALVLQKNAVKDLYLFLQNCYALQQRDMIYDDVSICVKLPGKYIDVHIQPDKRKGLFG